jgi:cytochrome c oxidase subunit 2
MGNARRWLLLAMLLFPSGCYLSNHNVLVPEGVQAERIRNLFLVFVTVLTVVYIAVVIAAVIATRRGRRRASPLEDEATNTRANRTVAIATGVTVVILLGLMAADFATGRAVAGYRGNEGAMTIQVIGHQWWWEIVYEDSVPERRITTSNEIHLPVGRPVLIKTDSRDVNHSVWLPNIAGKRDNLPGYTGMLWLRVDRPGIYTGQCAEFCGHQHAKMRLTLVAHSPEDFSKWYQAQRLPAAEPTDSTRLRGQEVFLAAPCVMCHTIRGTPAGARLGPDLTHIGSQLTIGAGSLPNTRGHLASWIVDSQRIKPGNRMPPIALNPNDLNALVHYLESLK